MFTRVLIANRGEIACRIARSCRRLGVETVAVYSDADAQARHVRAADRSLHIGPAPAAQSYLDAQRIVAAALASGAQAVHPGYGFLSERLELLQACEQAGLVFVGPHAGAIAQMGSKIESKRIARAAGVPCVPGYDGDEQGAEWLQAEAERIGYPLLIKASAGGGGKGMKLVRRADEFAMQLQAAQGEALAAFGDARVLLERFVTRPRHLEVQLLGDKHGGLVHLYERECSIQRHYQKLVEEAPAPHLSDAVREQLYAHALALGRAIGYDSTGTVEFVLDGAHGDQPFFLEMNTRLQVEHPVTEAITGLDLVESQLRSAAGERLAMTQQQVARRGWAIEARVNAEVPEQGFAPSFGTVQRYAEPAAAEGLRIDSGIAQGSEVSPYYDSLLAKVIGSGATREIARQRVIAGLAGLRIEGLRTTQRLLQDVLAHTAFDAPLSTGFLAEAFPGGWQPGEAAEQCVRAVAAAAVFHAALPTPRSPFTALTGLRLGAAAGIDAGYAWIVEDGEGGALDVRVRALSRERVQCSAGERCWNFLVQSGLDGVLHVADTGSPARWELRLDADERERSARQVSLWGAGDYRRLRALPRVALRSQAAGGREEAAQGRLCADLPGLLKQLLVQPGDEVAAGQPLAVIEAMKLFHTLVAPAPARVLAVSERLGQTLAKGELVVALALAAPAPSA